MNIIEEFMKKYTEVLRQLAAGEIDNEEAFEQLMVMRDESAGISSHVRSAHLKELSSIIHAAVDHMCAEVAARCEHSIILQVAGCPYNFADLQHLVNRVKLANDSVYFARTGEKIKEEHEANRALVVKTNDSYTCTIFAGDFVLYSFGIRKDKNGALWSAKTNEQMVVEYMMRLGMMDPRLQWGKQYV